MTVAYNVALKGCTLPIPSGCPEPFEALMKSCWTSDSAQRPSFSEVLDVLRSARTSFVATSTSRWTMLQREWGAEMEAKFSELVRTEKEIVSQQRELEHAQHMQLLHQQV